MSPRVLLVEDDPPIRETTALLLESFGFAVSAAADGQAGLNAFRAGTPDVALLDVMLPF
ncbi:MAG: response regulator, partial [Solirubrobacterales bacterium]|nr:response regulator [Solirubrobacterales bacterium]